MSMAKGDKESANKQGAGSGKGEGADQAEALRDAGRRAADLAQNPYARSLLAAGLVAAAAALASNRSVREATRRNVKAMTEAAEVGAENAGRIGVAIVNAATEAVQRMLNLGGAVAGGAGGPASAGEPSAPAPAAPEPPSPPRAPRARKATAAPPAPEAPQAKPRKPRAPRKAADRSAAPAAAGAAKTSGAAGAVPAVAPGEPRRMKSAPKAAAKPKASSIRPRAPKKKS
jgi:hypothetical protein